MFTDTKLLLMITLFWLAVAQSPTSIVTGPIIGKVTTTTARVLIEFNSATLITLILTDPTGQQFTAQKNTIASIPVAFAFDGLQPNTKYLVSLSDPTISITESYFTTLSGESGKLNFAVLSCMDKGVQASKKSKADLWADILNRIQNNEISYLLQTGDQVYMDDPFGKQDQTKPYFACSNILNSTSRDQWDSQRPQLLEILRNEYRATWNIPSVKETLAKVPSLTILDDHQVRDDWGYLAQDIDPNSVDFFYGTLARQVYYEYERQLREDIDFTNLTSYTEDYYFETLNDIGFIFIEYRGVRTWNRNFSQMGTSQLGAVQTQFLQQILDPNTGPLANSNNLFFISPLTVVFLVEALVKIGYYDNNDAEESWTFKYKDEQADLLNLLRTWKLAKSGRDLTILDGDVHIGGFTDITYDDDFTFLQFTTSSIASSAPGDLTFLAFDALKEIQNLIDPWSYEHHDWTNKFNYGIVLADENNGAASTDCYLIKADSKHSPEIIDVDGHKLDEDDWNEVLGRS